MAQRVVYKDKRGHCFDHRNRSWQDARIMPATCLEGRIVKADIYCLLLVHYRCDGLERNAKVDCLAVGDAALDPARTIRCRINLSSLRAKRIVVLQPR